jgi:cell wall-associated NlpC family hydrolase
MDIRKYIGIPFKDGGRDFSGLDCWGLVRLVWQEEKGILMPDMGDAYSSAFARGEVGETAKLLEAGNWNIDVTDQPRKELDVLVFSFASVDLHVGLWVAPGEMLHVMKGMDTAIERYDKMKWAKRLSRVLRPAGAQG